VGGRCVPRRARHPEPDAGFRSTGNAVCAEPDASSEDYADKWSKDRRLELNFRLWHAQASRDFEQLLLMTDAVSLRTATRRSFRVDLSDDHLKRLGLPSSPSPAIITSAAPVVRISSAPRPWGTAQ
jgi:hypothetical protein